MSDTVDTLFTTYLTDTIYLKLCKIALLPFVDVQIVGTEGSKYFLKCYSRLSRMDYVNCLSRFIMSASICLLLLSRPFHAVD
jgi:hypothetical protein